MAYNILFLLFAGLAFPLVLLIFAFSEKRRKTFSYRFRMQFLPKSFTTKPVWVHALSVGEVLSAVPFIQEMKGHSAFHRPVVLSVSTLTGYETAKKMVGSDVESIFFFPYDMLWSVRKMIRRVQPAIFFLIETDLWPNVLHEMKRLEIPIVWVNGRISPRSLSGYKCFSRLMRSVFSWISVICVQSEIDARRFLSLGVAAEKIEVTGNIKFDRDMGAITDEEGRNLRAALMLKENQRIFLAGSTHEGEESLLLEAFLTLKREFRELILMVAPRDPKRAGEVGRLAQRLVPTVFTMTDLEKAADRRADDLDIEVIVVDTMGVLARLYALAEVAFIGGSLVHAGGHNPLEPAAFGKPVLFGPDMSDFPAVAQMLVHGAGAVQVNNRQEIVAVTRELLGDENKARRMGACALQVFKNNSGAVTRTLELAEKFCRQRSVADADETSWPLQ